MILRFDEVAFLGQRLETQISQLCEWALEPTTRGLPGLALPATFVPASVGQVYRECCFAALATFG